MSFNTKSLRRQNTLPFSTDLEKQHDETILCLPFTTSPLSLLQHADSLSYKQATICRHLRLLPSTIKANFVSLIAHLTFPCEYRALIYVASQIAAYPVLIPLYLAQYEYEVLDESYIINFILDVSSRSVCASPYTSDSARLISTQGRIICEVVPQAIRDSMGKEFATYRDGDKSPGFANVKRLMAPRSSDHLAQKLNEWVDKGLANPGTAKLLADESAVDFDDLRVREFVEQERQANYHYLGMCADIINLRELLKVSFLSSQTEHLCHLTQTDDHWHH